MVDAIITTRFFTGVFSQGTEPAQVLGLVATRVTATFVQLDWNTTTNALSYNIYVNGQLFANTTDSEFNVTGLSPNTLYTFQVAGCDAVLTEGPRSSTIQTTTLNVPEWIGIPFPLFDLNVASSYDLKAFISPAPTAGYAFTNIGTALPSGVTLNGSTGVLTYDGVGGLSDVSTYSFRYNDNANPVTDVTGIRIQIKDDTIPTVPTNLQSASITPATFTLSWTASSDPGGNLTGYKIYRNGVLFTTVGLVTSFAVTGQAEGSTNSWRVSAIDGAGHESGQSAALSVQQTTSGLVFAINNPTFLSIHPGATGFGMSTAAGSGRDQISGGLAAAPMIYFVTNLNLSGAGSLKAALQATGRRIIIPTVSGVINYFGQAENTGAGNGRNITITDGNMSYWGQCAPAPGLIVRGAKIYVNTNAAKDIHFWHLDNLQDVYNDPTSLENNADCWGVTGTTTNIINADLICSNCAFMHGSDELVGVFYGAHNITFYRCLMAEPFHATNHPKGPHGFGPLFTNNRHTCRAAMIQNLLAHCFTRHPATSAAQFAYVNNVVYNPGDRVLQLEGRTGEPNPINNIEGNVFIKGPSTTATAATPIHRAPGSANLYPAGATHWLTGNRVIGAGWDDSTQAALLGGSSNGTFLGARDDTVWPNGLAVTSTVNREEYVRLLLRYVGPRPGQRWSHYQRVVNHVQARLTGVGSQGAIINGPADFGGWPTVTGTSINHTQGADPIPGITTQSSTPTQLGTNGRTIMPSGYTNLEEWAHRKHNALEPA